MSDTAGLQKIFPLLQDVSSVEHLKKITSDHPYFSIAQLYFLHHAKNDSSFLEKQSTKTALFFNNIHWLNWQLNSQDDNVDTITEADRVEKVITENTIDATEEEPTFKSNINFGNEVKEDTIAFEPLHTTDYFLSQGIKLTDEPLVNDKLGTQMKSFTEWLKSMKKIHAEKPAGTDDQTDKKIQTIAEDSNASTDVVTEAMADVLAKQNKFEKAIEMYHQLSLINPGKSAYFAAKINILKTP